MFLLAGLLAADAGALELQVLSEKEGIPRGVISSLLAADGTLYVGMAEMGLVSRDLKTGVSKRYAAGEGIPTNEVKSLAAFRGKVYVGTSDGLAVLDGSRWSVIREAENVPLKNVSLGASPEAGLWVGALHLSGGTLTFDGREWKTVGGQGRGLFNNVNSFAFFRGGVLMGSTLGAVYTRKGPAVEALKAGFPAANVFALAERGGAFYVGTNKGLFIWRGQSWEPARLPEGFAGKAVFSILRADADLFVGGVQGLVLLDRKGAQKVLSSAPGFPGGPVTALAGFGETVYAGTDQGVAAFTGWRE